MYFRPHLIWVLGLVRQSLPELRILRPGRAWGMPYEPLTWPARVRQPLSRFQSFTRHLNWVLDQWRCFTKVLAIAWLCAFWVCASAGTAATRPTERVPATRTVAPRWSRRGLRDNVNLP